MKPSTANYLNADGGRAVNRRDVMIGSRLALVANDQRLGNVIQAHLIRSLGQAAFTCTLDAVHTHLHCETGALLLLAAASRSESEKILKLVEEIYIKKLPPIIMIVEETNPEIGKHLQQLDAYVSQRLRWPEDADRLTQAIRERIGRVGQLVGQTRESVPDQIRRRLLGQTPSLKPLVERIALAAAHEVTVLLTGETGTGKTYLARILHDFSPRKNAPFLTVPCGAQPANLVQSAFFGHVRGAFTGADRAKIGKFEVAGTGTILLDEIDTLGLEQQAGLLRVMETGEYEPVGSNETRHCEARFIVASNLDLEEAVQTGKFRQDLYYRLNVMSFHLPPLRERWQDIAPLVHALTARFNAKFRKDLFDINPLAMEALEDFPWPGNIRQLENFVQQVVLLSSGPELLLEHLPQQVRDYRATHRATTVSVHTDNLVHNRKVLECNVIQRILEKNGLSRACAATALGISRVTLYKKMKKYGLMNGSHRSHEGGHVSHEGMER
jgi:DNA-binding NtrC family response regulator